MDLLLAKETDTGFTWTLPSRLGDMLVHAEKMFGERDRSWTILGIEFADSGPMIWYPKALKNIIIQLSPDSRSSEACALYELAHECIHLLSPTGGARATVLEEGLAVWFSWYYVELVTGLRPVTRHTQYRNAGLLVDEILKRRRDFFLQARTFEPSLSSIDQSLIEDLSGISSEKAYFLATKFADSKNTFNTPLGLSDSI